MKRVLGLGGAFLALAVCGSAAGQFATPMAGGPPASLRDQGPGRTSQSITRGQSFEVAFPDNVRTVQLTNPLVADVNMITPSRAAIMGIGYGRTDVQFYDAAGRRVMSIDLTVEQDISSLNSELGRLLPDDQVTARSVNEHVLLTGRVANAAAADRAVRVAAMFAGSPDRVQNLLEITGNDQVTLQVQVVEVNRTVLKQLGFDTNFVFGQLGVDQFTLGNSPGYAVNGGYQGGFQGGFQRNTTRQPMLERDFEVPVQVYDEATGTYHTEFQTRTYTVVDRDDLIATPQDSIGAPGTNQARSLMQAFERQGLVRTIAEPNATTVSGQPAVFRAGGEFPVASGRDQSGNIQTEFKPFGVGLAFTPVVLSGGRISITISAEVSELSSQGSLTLVDSSGQGTLTIPGLTVRSIENTVELPSGGSIMAAGLLQEQTRQNIDKIPGIADFPLFGALARSRDYLNNETELVIIVTAFLTSPTSRDRLQTPADGLQIASDMETVLMGKLNTAYGRAGAPPPAQSYEGPFGHVID